MKDLKDIILEKILINKDTKVNNIVKTKEEFINKYDLHNINGSDIYKMSPILSKRIWDDNVLNEADTHHGAEFKKYFKDTLKIDSNYKVRFWVTDAYRNLCISTATSFKTINKISFFNNGDDKMTMQHESNDKLYDDIMFHLLDYILINY